MILLGHQQMKVQVMLNNKYNKKKKLIPFVSKFKLDGMTTVQVPTNWRSAFLELDSLKLFFDLYRLLPPRLSSLALT